MMTKEEFKKTYTRMMDFYRKKRPFYEETKGKPNCRGLSCSPEACPFYATCCNKNDEGIQYNAFEAIEIVEKWSEEHPIITKAEKFKQVFGEFTTPESLCPATLTQSKECESHLVTCQQCKEHFWNQEYEQPERT